MGLILTPRTIAAIARGLLERRAHQKLPIGSPESVLRGFDPSHPYIYQGRAGLLDSDYLGHLNNAAYLTHTELARWQMCAYSGILQAVYAQNCSMLLTASAIRYRQDIRPVFRTFQVECYLAGLDLNNDNKRDNNSMFIMHKFRYPIAGHNRVRAQVLSRGVFVKNREILDPRVFLIEAGIHSNVVDRLSCLPFQTKAAPELSSGSSISRNMEGLLESFVEMEESMRNEAAEDDALHDEGL